MGDLINIQNKQKQKIQPEGPFPVFKGKIDFEESPILLDFAELFAFTVSQLPERSKFNWLREMEKLQELCDVAVSEDYIKIIRKLMDMGLICK